jgi:hypothetical protein
MRFVKYLFTLIILISSVQVSRAQFELTSPLTATQVPLQLIKAGSLIIPMDTINQKRPGFFNLKAYGLVNELLQNEIPVRWAIRPGKSKNGSDFTVSATRIYPDIGTTAATIFSQGPFIIDSAYVSLATPIILAYGNNVHVFRLESNANINIRYNLTFKPKIALLNGGGYDTIAVRQMQEAGISASTYELFMPAGQTFNPTKSYSTISETHLGNRDTGKTNPILRYVTNKGANFISQCTTIGSFENTTFSLTTLGVDSGPPLASPGSFIFNSTDQALAQFQGGLIVPYGDYKLWNLKPGSAFKSNVYHIVRSLTYHAVSAAKVLPNSMPGGNILYLAGHDFYFWGNAGGGTPNDFNRINGRRIYLNALFMPPNDSLPYLDFRNDVTVSISHSPGFAVKTEAFKFYIVAKNTGLGLARNVNINIPLPPGLLFTSHNESKGVYNSGTQIWTIDSLPRGANDTLELTVTINALGNINLSAVATTNSFETNKTNNTATDVVFGVSRPTVVNDTLAFPFGTFVDVYSKFNDSDEDGDVFGNFTITVPPNHGTASITNGDSIRYTLGPGYSGTDSIQYVSCDVLPLCDTAWIYIIVPTPLPISMASFDGIRKNGKVDLKWITFSEKNNDFFTVEKSLNGNEFNGIVEIKGAGTSNQIHYYDYTDLDSGEPILYYRIRQTDYDGTTSLSHIISLRNNDNSTLQLTIYPNPNSGEQMVLKVVGLDEEAVFTITDLTGRLILKRAVNVDKSGNFLDIINADKKLEAGTYVASIVSASQKISTRIIVD